MIQTILVILLFCAAVAYLGRMLYKSFSGSESGCAKGCGSCPASKFADFPTEK